MRYSVLIKDAYVTSITFEKMVCTSFQEVTDFKLASASPHQLELTS